MLRAEVCHAGIHPPAKDWIAGMQAVTGDIIVGGFGDTSIIILQTAPQIIVGGSKGIAVDVADNGFVERAGCSI